MKIGDIKYISNKQRIVVAKVFVYEIDSHFIHIKTYVTDSILNPTILKLPLEKKDELIFDTYTDAMCDMGIFFYNQYGIEEWIQLAKNKFPEKFI